MPAFNDEGKTWCNAEPVNPLRVWPDALVLQNGIMAVSYGQPGNWLMFSKDEGSTWEPNIPYYNDIYPPDCSNYVSIREIAPNIIRSVYTRTYSNYNSMSEVVSTWLLLKTGN